MTAWMSPPVTMFAVPIVSSTKPQKMPACIRPARESLNIFVWTKAYWIEPVDARADVVERARARGPGGGEDPQVAGHRQGEDQGGAPEQREDERVRRDVLEDGNISESRSRRRSSPGVTWRARAGRGLGQVGPRPRGPRRRRRGRTVRRASRGRAGAPARCAASDSSAAARAARHVDDEGPAADADDAARQVGHRRARPPGRAHGLGEARAPRSR